MSFFLDDVPDPNAPVVQRPVGSAPGPDGEAGPEAPGWVPGIPTHLSHLEEHPPVAAGQCSRCHDYSSKERGGVVSGFRLGTQGGSNLRKPIRLLCVSCHTQYSAATAEEEGLWLHGPVGAGRCTRCHDQHRSPNPRMLKAWPPKQLCLQCHNATRLGANEDHPPFDEDDCTTCHNPHRGETRWLL